MVGIHTHTHTNITYTTFHSFETIKARMKFEVNDHTYKPGSMSVRCFGRDRAKVSNLLEFLMQFI